MSRKDRQLIVTHESGAYFRQFSFSHFRETIIDPRANDKVKHGVSEKLKSFVIL
jgi:hypothetical protein